MHAVTGRPQEADYLKGLGAAEIVDRKELAGPAKPLAKERWAGAIDAVGSNTLANLLSMTRYGGAVAACGLAGGMDLPGSVAPFILRGVCLYGIDSVMCPVERRREAWKRLENDLDRQKLATMTREIGLSGRVRGGSGDPVRARCAAGSWSKSGKHVQDLSTKAVHNLLGLKIGPSVL